MSEENKGEGWVDPGQSEGNKIDPKKAQENITEDHPRFKEVYGKMKDSERKLEELTKTLEDKEKSTKEAIEAMAEHNKKLAEAFEKNKSVPVTLEDRLPDLQEKLASAIDADNTKEALRIQSEISDIKLEARLNKINIPDKDEIVESVTKANEVIDEKKQTTDWIAQNAWYRDNPDAKFHADALYDKMANDKTVKSHAEALNEVAKQIKKIYNIEDNGNNDAATVERGRSVESTRRKTTRTGKIELTDNDKFMADTFNIPYDEYAKQLEVTNGGAK